MKRPEGSLQIVVYFLLAFCIGVACLLILGDIINVFGGRS